MFQRFVSLSAGHDDGTSGVEFSTVEERIKDILSFQNGKTERSEKWRTAFTTSDLWPLTSPRLRQTGKSRSKQGVPLLPGRQPPPALPAPRVIAET